MGARVVFTISDLRGVGHPVFCRASSHPSCCFGRDRGAETVLQDPGHYSPPGSIGTRPSADCGAGEGTDKKPGKTRI